MNNSTVYKHSSVMKYKKTTFSTDCCVCVINVWFKRNKHADIYGRAHLHKEEREIEITIVNVITPSGVPIPTVFRNTAAVLC